MATLDFPLDVPASVTEVPTLSAAAATAISDSVIAYVAAAAGIDEEDVVVTYVGIVSTAGSTPAFAVRVDLFIVVTDTTVEAVESRRSTLAAALVTMLPTKVGLLRAVGGGGGGATRCARCAVCGVACVRASRPQTRITCLPNAIN